ncbi:MAG: hypothetical protein ACXWC6_01375 [Ramlibacter sp.]
MNRGYEEKWSRQAEERAFWNTVIAVVTGLLIAGAIAGAVRLWFVYMAVEQIKNITTTVSNQSAEQIRRAQQAQEAAMWAARQKEAERASAAAAQAQAAAERARALEEAKRAQLVQVEAREDAWARYYRRPAACEKPEGQAFVDCANDYIRAKRKFEELYSAGRL